MNINHRLTLILAATALIAGCGKGSSLSENSDNEIKYKVGFASITTKSSETAMDGSEFLLSNATGTAAVPMTGEVSGWFSDGRGVATKGQLVNATGSDDTPQNYGITSFVASAYDGETPIYTEEEVTYSSSTSKWGTEDTYYWPAETSLDFYAYANLPDESAYTSVTIAETGVTLSGYNVPGTASEQTDILLGSYHGYGFGSGTAEIRFEHPLTAVRFLYGGIEGNPSIKSISLEGVAASGTVAMDEDGMIEWSGVSDFDHTVSQTDESGLGLSDLTGHTAKLIGEPFIIIPQDLEENNVTVTVTLVDDTVFEAMLSAGTWQAGKTNTYTLGYSVTDPDLLPGKFSVSETEYVQFSRGNLYCTRDTESGPFHFAFEENQYDYRCRSGVFGDKAVFGGTETTTPSSTSGLFQWIPRSSSSATGDWGAFSKYKTCSDFNNTDVLDFGGVFPGSDWITLTGDQWRYLLNHHQYRIGVSVIGVAGLAIAPDDYDGEISASYTTLEQWTAAENAGIVFLPLYGFYCHDDSESIGTNEPCYWSSSPVSGSGDAVRQATALHSYGSSVAVNERWRFYGQNVRLVQKFDWP